MSQDFDRDLMDNLLGRFLDDASILDDMLDRDYQLISYVYAECGGSWEDLVGGGVDELSLLRDCCESFLRVRRRQDGRPFMTSDDYEEQVKSASRKIEEAKRDIQDSLEVLLEGCREAKEVENRIASLHGIVSDRDLRDLEDMKRKIDRMTLDQKVRRYASDVRESFKREQDRRHEVDQMIREIKRM